MQRQQVLLAVSGLLQRFVVEKARQNSAPHHEFPVRVCLHANVMATHPHWPIYIDRHFWLGMIGMMIETMHWDSRLEAPICKHMQWITEPRLSELPGTSGCIISVRFQTLRAFFAMLMPPSIIITEAQPAQCRRIGRKCKCTRHGTSTGSIPQGLGSKGILWRESVGRSGEC